MTYLYGALLAGLCVLLGGAAVLHVVAPSTFTGIVPAPLQPVAVPVVFVSGVCEAICAIMLAVPVTRRLGSYATAALFIAVFPANVQMALDSGFSTTLTFDVALIWLRLPLQVPLIAWALLLGRRPRAVIAP